MKNTNKVILNLIQNLPRLSWSLSLRNSIRGRSRIKYGMTPSFYNGKAFTLIELLVVVLIIGILAAVALPQYQKAVEKSKATQAQTLLKSISQAAEEYYLANGMEITSFDNLSIELPSSFTGNVKALPDNIIGTTSDVKSNNEWSLQLTDSGDGWTIFWISRISGKYKGGGFATSFSGGGEHRNNVVGCFELTAGNYAFSLPEGAYCHEIMKANRVPGDDSNGMRRKFIW